LVLWVIFDRPGLSDRSLHVRFSPKADLIPRLQADDRYIDATRSVLRERGGLWFFDESYVISRRRA
jgi:hypothetical protein